MSRPGMQKQCEPHERRCGCTPTLTCRARDIWNCMKARQRSSMRPVLAANSVPFSTCKCGDRLGLSSAHGTKH